MVQGVSGTGGLALLDPTASPSSLCIRTFLEKFLKDAVRAKYTGNLKVKPNQGKVFKATLKWETSDHFMPHGNFTCFSDWCFIHCAHLNCLLLNGTICYRNQDKRCQGCEYESKALPHERV